MRKREVEKIIVLGGDGTLFHIVSVIDKKWNIPFSLFPSGSGNDFIKSVFGKNRNLDFFYENFKKGKIKKANVGKIEGNEIKLYFSNAAGFGFDAKIAKRALKIRNLRGLIRYLISLLIELKGKISYEMEIISQKINLKENFIVAGFGIGKYLGGGFFLFPEASPFEENLSVCLIRKMDKMDVLKKLPKAIKGEHMGLKEVVYFKTKKLFIRINEEISAQLDGEVFEIKENEFTISLSEKKLPILSI